MEKKSQEAEGETGEQQGGAADQDGGPQRGDISGDLQVYDTMVKGPLGKFFFFF